MLTRILAPVDFSEPARAAAAYASRLASRTGAHLSLLHMVAPVTLDYSMIGPSPDVLGDLTKSRLTHARSALAQLAIPGARVSRDVVEGDAAIEILRRAHEERSDLIVMSTRGAGAIKRMFGVGSVTLNVLAGAECPVLTGIDFAVPPEVDDGTIVCALDLGPTAEKTLRWAGRAASALRARLVVVHATTLADKKTLEWVSDDWFTTLHRRVDQHFRDLLARTGVDGDLVVGDGSPHDVVAAAANARRAGWIVIGRSPARDLMDRLRANSYDIIRRAPCPVVSV
jgi:nucleotide-binding universal stress UspA family protein